MVSASAALQTTSEMFLQAVRSCERPFVLRFIKLIRFINPDSVISKNEIPY